MKISSQQVQLITKLYQEQKARSHSGPKTAPEQSGDKVIISDASQEIQKAMTKLAALPDVRAEKVAELKNAIQTDAYRVSPRDVAEKFLARLAVEEMLQDD
ncbi:MAG: flagellar biosynthesis anti-sigma factor FlgM [Firmicutes bacterium]|nr:flagellar biosynthesis anti-sigma factor FlgM [Bacillota bacterium]